MKAASFTQKRDGWAGRRTHLSGGDATLLSSHAGRSFTPDADKTRARQPEGDSQATSQTSGDQDPTTATRHCHPDTDGHAIESPGAGCARRQRFARFVLGYAV